MTIWKSRCKLCKKYVVAIESFEIMIKQGEHLKKFHPKEYNENKKAYTEYQRLRKIAKDYRIKNEINYFKDDGEVPEEIWDYE